MSIPKRARPLRQIGILLIIAATLLGSTVPGATDSQSVELGAGGLVARSENNISIEHERLVISGLMNETRIVVEYDFLNHANHDISTLVAFPVPDHFCPIAVGHHIEPGFDDFRLWVDGEEVKYETENRAIHDGHDFTNILTSMGIDIPSFGRYHHETPGGELEAGGTSFQIPKLSHEAKNILKEFGLIEWHKSDPSLILPLWTVRKKYFWNQRFPAGKAVRIRHEYRAREGFDKITAHDIDTPQFLISPGSERWTFADACVPGPKIQDFKRHLTQHERNELSAYWVKYILTSANTWRKPIKNFELVIEVDPPWEDVKKEDVWLSFCWDGPVTRSGDRVFRSVINNFVPARDLVIYRFCKISYLDD